VSICSSRPNAQWAWQTLDPLGPVKHDLMFSNTQLLCFHEWVSLSLLAPTSELQSLECSVHLCICLFEIHLNSKWVSFVSKQSEFLLILLSQTKIMYSRILAGYLFPGFTSPSHMARWICAIYLLGGRADFQSAIAEFMRPLPLSSFLLENTFLSTL